MALLKNCLFASVALTLIVSACANKDLSVHRNVVCKTYRAPKSVYAIQSSESMTAVPAVAMVSDKFNVLDIAVGVNITHPNVGALKISLEAREPCSVHNNMLTHGNAASKVSCVDAETRQTRLLANYGGCVLFFYICVCRLVDEDSVGDILPNATLSLSCVFDWVGVLEIKDID